MNGREGAVSVGPKENVIIEAGECRVTILPQFGGKIASIRVRGKELLQQPLAPIAERTRTMAFDECDASGWDECLPSVAACSVEYGGREVQIPDHGDVWRVPAENREQTAGNSAVTVWDCFSLPLRLERTVELREALGDWRLRLFYKLTNNGVEPAPWSWAAHPLFAVDAGDCINLPDEVSTLRLEGSAGGRLGTRGDAVSWPVAKLANANGETDLRFAQPPSSGIGDKLFAGPFESKVGWCEVLRPEARVAIRVSFESEKTPYLGLWICYGGWPERPGAKQMCVAIEPATTPVDSLAESGPWNRMLAPGGSNEWAMIVTIKTF